MDASPPPAASCPACSASVDPRDNFCRRCGKEQRPRVPWYYEQWGIILLTLTGLGPFGLILVWRSPRLTGPARWAYTAATLLVTWWVSVQCYRAWQLMSSLLQSFTQGLGL